MKVYTHDIKRGCKIVETEIPTVEEFENMTIEEMYNYMLNCKYAFGGRTFDNNKEYGSLSLSIDYYNSVEDAENVQNGTTLTFKAWRRYKKGLIADELVRPKEDTERTVARIYYLGEEYGKDDEVCLVDKEVKGYVI